MRVAVLGAGNGGVASAFDFAQHGHEASLYAPPEFGSNLEAIADAGGITATGDLEGFAPIRYAGRPVEGGTLPAAIWKRVTDAALHGQAVLPLTATAPPDRTP